MSGPKPGCSFKITSGMIRIRCTKPNTIPAIYAHDLFIIANTMIAIKMTIDGYTTYGRVCTMGLSGLLMIANCEPFGSKTLSQNNLKNIDPSIV